MVSKPEKEVIWKIKMVKTAQWNISVEVPKTN